jgi:alpha-tubulin suppressor-like RCC1 family protein
MGGRSLTEFPQEAPPCRHGRRLRLLAHARGCLAVACGNPWQLGAGTREDQDAPARVAGLEGRPDVVLLAAGYEHAVAITSAGELRVLGRNKFGELGQSDREDRLVTVTLGPPQFGAPVAMVACGGKHMLVVTRAGRLFAFGCENYGHLGLGNRATEPCRWRLGRGASAPPSSSMPPLAVCTPAL